MHDSLAGKAIAANTQRDTHGLLQTLDSDTRGKQFSQSNRARARRQL